MRKMKLRFQLKPKLESRYIDQTDDNLVDLSQKQFFKQQDEVILLQTSLRVFNKGITSLTETIDNMYSSFKGIYEPSWVGNVEFNHMCQESIKIWRQFIADFKFNILKSIDEYGQEFPEMKRSIERRNKKLSELKKHRCSFENYRNAKRVDEIKLKKAEEELKNAEREYQNQNNVLKDTLPKFCDKRIRVYVQLWTKLFEAEEAMFSFLQEGRKNQLSVLSRLAGMADSDQYSIKSQVNLGNDNVTNLLSTKEYAKSAMSLINPDRQLPDQNSSDHGSLTHINTINSKVPNNVSVDSDSGTFNRAKSYQVTNLKNPSEFSDSSKPGFFSMASEKITLRKRISFTESSEVTKSQNRVSTSNNTMVNDSAQYSIKSADTSDIDGYNSDDNPYSKIRKDTSSRAKGNKKGTVGSFESYRNSHVYDTVRNSTYFYQVEANFDYYSQDEDELNLRKNDIILVLPWQSEEEMEEGWLYGENVLTKHKGLFPENHTARLLNS